jgi:hypothetical protein
MKFRELFENNKGQEFENSFKISWTDAKKIAKNYGQKWEMNGSLALMYDGREHVMTYNKKEGKLFTDFDEDQIHDMIKGISESAPIGPQELNLNLLKYKSVNDIYELLDSIKVEYEKNLDQKSKELNLVFRTTKDLQKAAKALEKIKK